MPTAERYARYRADQTTIWVSKTAAAFLSRERESAGEGAAAVLDRLLHELRRLRRGARGAGARGGGAPGGAVARGGTARGASARKDGAKAAPRKAAGRAPRGATTSSRTRRDA